MDKLPGKRECIILAGGFGTRLRDTIPGIPKPLAPVAGKPFLTHVINNLRMQGVEYFIFSLGHQSGMIIDFLENKFPTLHYSFVVEEEPLGTGGGIKLALEKAGSENVIVANGDTLFKIDLDKIFDVHEASEAECTLALKPMNDFDRYGMVETDDHGRITSFHEKKFYSSGSINGGIYIINKQKLMARELPSKFSFEKDYLEKFAVERNFFSSVQDGYFIDIGVPDDFNKAQEDLHPKSFDLSSIDDSWTLFLDRDGVINEEKIGHYVLHWDEFIFSKGVLDVFKKLHERFGLIIVVTNQRGVGKELMTEAALQSIHLEMQREVEIVGARIAKIYYCTDMNNKHFCRKPNPGMAYKARKDFPCIDLSKTIMVGNKPSDMAFGRAAGMFTVFVKTTNPDQEFPHQDIDAVFPSLPAFAEAL
jgi:D-glycero-alpha-D-manno-heptose 1-phosphate guanylyltransferase